MNNTETNEPATNHLSAADIRAMLRHLDTIGELTLAMRKEVRAPSASELYGAVDVLENVRNMLLEAALTDVEIV